VTQALLGDPELLVLDEAWTGLDTAARAELAAVVRERTRGGACVVFVDHDPARLDGDTDERWVVRDTALLAAAENEAVARAAAAASGRMAVEVTGVAASVSLATLLPDAEIVAGPGGGLRITIGEGRSDDVLRLLLALGPEVHIAAVSPAPTRIRANEES
jgi:energy-coupling factor transporter ATP-binding protein EcfA2